MAGARSRFESLLSYLGGGCPGKAGWEDLASLRGGGWPGKAGWLVLVSALSRIVRLASACWWRCDLLACTRPGGRWGTAWLWEGGTELNLGGNTRNVIRFT